MKPEMKKKILLQLDNSHLLFCDHNPIICCKDCRKNIFSDTSKIWGNMSMSKISGNVGYISGDITGIEASVSEILEVLALKNET